MSGTLNLVSWLLLMSGSFFVVISGVGLVRLPDFFTRMHAAGIVDTMGSSLIIAGLLVQEGATQVSVKLLLILVFLFFTSPTSTHAVGHAALAAGLVPWTKNKRKDGP